MLDVSLINATLPSDLAEVASTHFFVNQPARDTVIVISRMKDEGIVIGDDIVVTVTEIQGDDIRLHIERPPGVPVKKRAVGETIEQVVETLSPA